MKKSFMLKKIFAPLVFALILFVTGCSVHEDSTEKFKTIAVCVPSAKNIISQPQNYSEMATHELYDEWYMYSELELISETTGLSQKINNLEFGKESLFVVTPGLYKIKARIVMGKKIEDDYITVSTYGGDGLVTVIDDVEIINKTLEVSPIYRESVYSLDYFSDYDSNYYRKFLPGKIIVKYFGVFFNSDDTYNRTFMVGEQVFETCKKTVSVDDFINVISDNRDRIYELFGANPVIAYWNEHPGLPMSSFIEDSVMANGARTDFNMEAGVDIGDFYSYGETTIVEIHGNCIMM